MHIDIQGDYRQLRTQGYPAALALRIARNQARLHAWIAELGLEWDKENYQPVARWRQDGFNIIARRLVDEDGWWVHGDEFGEFTDQWAPGAVRHRGERGEYRWFVPADPEQRHSLYERARTYGRTWWYETLEVQAWRAGVLLGEASLSGIESDSDEDYFTETALELADEAIAEGRAALKRLCQVHDGGCHEQNG